MTARETIETAVVTLMDALRLPRTEGNRNTPKRVAKMWTEELCAGRNASAADILGTTFPAESYAGPVVMREIPFYSTCEHHLLPFFGKATVGYVPGARIVGLSKLARLVQTLARQPQTQEALTARIADALQVLSPRGTLVRLEATHMCMAMRGAQAQGATTATQETRGVAINVDHR